MNSTLCESVAVLGLAGFRLLAIIIDGERVKYRTETREGRRYVFRASLDEVVSISEGVRER
jgi:hypothetical protein